MHPARRLLVLLVLVATACGASPEAEVDPAAEAAWQALLDEPSTPAYEAFLSVNRGAAGKHRSPHDVRGIEYQVRALLAQAGEAERTKDVLLAHTVFDRVRELRESGHLDLYEETHPGARARFLAAEAKILPLVE